jgi:hypothetical protein
MFPYLPAIYSALRHSEYILSLVSVFAAFAHIISKQSALVPVINREAVAR